MPEGLFNFFGSNSDSTSGTGSGLFGSTGILILMMVALFAIMIIPQRRRDKKIKTMLAAIKPGDRIRTIGGIYGTVSSIRDDVLTISVGPDKVRMVIARSAVANVEDAAVENTIEDGVK